MYIPERVRPFGDLHSRRVASGVACHSVSAPWQTNSNLTSIASRAFDAVVSKIDSKRLVDTSKFHLFDSQMSTTPTLTMANFRLLQILMIGLLT